MTLWEASFPASSLPVRFGRHGPCPQVEGSWSLANRQHIPWLQWLARGSCCNPARAREVWGDLSWGLGERGQVPSSTSLALQWCVVYCCRSHLAANSKEEGLKGGERKQALVLSLDSSLDQTVPEAVSIWTSITWTDHVPISLPISQGYKFLPLDCKGYMDTSHYLRGLPVC